MEDPETTMAGGTIAAVVLGIIVGLIVIGVLVGVIWYVCYYYLLSDWLVHNKQTDRILE